jgi:hypothetical protein
LVGEDFVQAVRHCARAVQRTSDRARAGRSLCYFPREVFFFGLGFVVAPVSAAVCRFCFFVAI